MSANPAATHPNRFQATQEKSGFLLALVWTDLEAFGGVPAQFPHNGWPKAIIAQTKEEAVSVHSFLRIPGILSEFRQHVPFPPLRLDGDLLAQPLTGNYSVVGQAFDYLLRFHLERVNRHAITTPWVAEAAVAIGTRAGLKLGRHLAAAKAAYKQFLKDGLVADALLAAALKLARLDVLYRVGKLDMGLDRDEDPRDLADLRALLVLAEQHPPFRLKHKVLALDPTFGVPGWVPQVAGMPPQAVKARLAKWGVKPKKKGYASLMIGGADVDLVLDEILVEIKTTKDLKVTPEIYYQLVSYYMLAALGGIVGLPRPYRVTRLGIYFPRFGRLVEVSAPVLSRRFVEWFIDSAATRGFSAPDR